LQAFKSLVVELAFEESCCLAVLYLCIESYASGVILVQGSNPLCPVVEVS
jgi:hypothetical protein